MSLFCNVLLLYPVFKYFMFNVKGLWNALLLKCAVKGLGVKFALPTSSLLKKTKIAEEEKKMNQFDDLLDSTSY